MTVSIGADPEFWLYDYENTSTGVIPCVGKVKGTKEAPFDLGDGYFTHEDNVSIELGIPVTDGTSLGHVVQEGKKRIIDTFFNTKRYELYQSSQVHYNSNQLTSKQAQTFGCEPDFDAYSNGKVRDIPSAILKGNTRFAGGHIHIGGDFKCPPFVAALFADLFISVTSQVNYTLQAGTKDPLKDRMGFYGRAGAFRPKPYGIEYRTPSNAWCASPKKGNAMGRNAFSLGVFLESTSATNLREMIKKIDWLRVREVVNPVYGTPGTQIRQKAEELLYDVRKLGVTV